MLMRRSFQEIDGQLESERKYVERLAVEDFGTTHVGKVMMMMMTTMIMTQMMIMAMIMTQMMIIPRLIISQNV